MEKASAGNRGAQARCCPTEGRTAAQHREPPRASSRRGQLLPSWLPPPSGYQSLWTTDGAASPCLCRGPLQPRWASARALPGLPPAAPKVTSGHPRHPEHAPSGNIALGAGPSMASALGTHHPEMVTATKATPRGSQARRLQPVSPVPPSLPPFTPHGDLPWGSSPQT